MQTNVYQARSFYRVAQVYPENVHFHDQSKKRSNLGATDSTIKKSGAKANDVVQIKSVRPRQLGLRQGPQVPPVVMYNSVLLQPRDQW